MTIQATKSAEPIPGYFLQERIGAGGYGEVWAADAPGGLRKAIKLVYGYHDEDRASRELKALNRIKDVRHPFLLSLERIEVVDGQLAIVTELADCSLKERFLECQQQYLPGIPREELLVYLRDAADALDYMRENFSLQHLDVKPENLLLVGGRVKVADFGLVKQLQNVTESLMGGLTPLYAAPEVFDGRPTLQSDQYSLAIVYQEMLTGEMPFPGTTAAQLANQHLHSKPRLAALPEPDQASIGHALEKNSNERFKSCVELVNDLCRPKESKEEKSTHDERESEQKQKSRPRSGQVSMLTRNRRGADGLLPRVDPSPKIWNADPISVDPNSAQLSPTLVIGIGGTGSRVLQNLRRHLRDAFDEPAAVPAIRMLLIDTDAKQLTHATQGRDDTCLEPHQTISMPLRRPQDYRDNSRQLTQSLSRRWLYNIPKSLQTEGLRPLGRLALLNHGTNLVGRLREEFKAMLDDEPIAKSEETTGIKYDKQSPRVLLVSSISGGTGSGMVLDVAYAVRSVLAELGISDNGLQGVLLHGTGRNPQLNELSIANAFACLSELAHYTRTEHAYPGEICCGVPRFEPETPAFEDAYLVHLGDDLTDTDFANRTDEVAQYIHLDIATPCGSLFSQARKSDQSLSLRTFGLCRIGLAQDEILSSSTDTLCKRVIRCWLGDAFKDEEPTSATNRTTSSLNRTSTKPAPSVGSEVEKLCSQHVSQADLSFSNISQTVHELVSQTYDKEMTPHAEQIVAEAVAAKHPTAMADAIAHFEILLEIRNDDGTMRSAAIALLPAEIRKVIDAQSAETSELLVQWIFGLIDRSSYHMQAAQTAAKWFDEHLQATRDQAADIERRIDSDLIGLKQALINQNPADRSRKPRRGQSEPDDSQRLMQIWQMQLLRLSVQGTKKLLSALKGNVGKATERMQDLRCELNHMVAEFDTSSYLPPLDDEAPKTAADLNILVAQQIQSRLPELARVVDAEFRKVFFQEQGLSEALSNDDVNAFAGLPDWLRRTARRVIINAHKEEDIIARILPNGEEPETVIQRTRDCVESAAPYLMQCGGAKRLLLVVPSDAAYEPLKSVIEQTTEEPVSIGRSDNGDVVLCYEMDQMSIAQVAAVLAENRPDYAQAASRLHARSDVNWAPWTR